MRILMNESQQDEKDVPSQVQEGASGPMDAPNEATETSSSS